MRIYIDPGTGSMLFTILIGVIGAVLYFFRDLFVKIRFYLSGGKKDKNDNNRYPIVIFSDDKRYWSTFESICDELEKRGQDAIYMTASSDDPGLNKEYKHIQREFIGEGNKAYSRMNFIKADIVLSTTPSLDVFQWKRSKDVNKYVHVLHSCNDVTGYRMFGLDYYDAVLTSGKFQQEQIRELEKLRDLPKKELVMVGLPYMDQLMERIKESPKSENNEVKTVLLAPSWGPNSILNKYGEKIIDALISTGYKIIVRPHPQTFTSEKEMIDKLMNKYQENDLFKWNRDNDNFNVMKEADILISDFSGIIFDFALVFDKPILVADTSFDPSVYDCWWLDEPMWTFKVLPKLSMSLSEDKIDNIKNIIDECINSSEFHQAREMARKEAWAYPWEGASRVVSYLTNTLEKMHTEA